MEGAGVSRPVDLAPGWHWLYTRGYDLAVPAERAFRWMADHAPSVTHHTDSTDPSPGAAGARIERRVYHRGRIVKLTRWELAPPDKVTFHDEVYRRGRLVLEGEERYRFFGGAGSGCIVEVTALRKPADWLSRVGFSLFPEWSVRAHNHFPIEPSQEPARNRAERAQPPAATRAKRGVLETSPGVVG